MIESTEATIWIGHKAISGLLTSTPPNSRYGVAVSQVAQQFHLREKYIEALLDVEPSKWSTDGHSVIDVLTLEQYEQVVVELAFNRHNIEAQEFLSSIAGLATRQLFSDAFGRVFDREARQRWLRATTPVSPSHRRLWQQPKFHFWKNN